MVTDLLFSERFKRNFRRLTEANKKIARDKLSQFLEDPFHPSLRTKKIQGAPGMWESSINMDIRMTWRWGEEEGVVELSDIGSHDKALGNP